MEVFFSKIDRDIIKKIQRDPLHEQVIWTKYASELYKHINSNASDIKGYIIASLGIEVVNSIPNKEIQIKRGEKRLARIIRNLYIEFEEIIAYMMIEKIKENEKNKKEDKFYNKDLSFIGKDNGTKHYNRNEKLIVSYKNPIIVNQIYLGYVGRYRNKLDKETFINEILDKAFGKDRKIIVSKLGQVLIEVEKEDNGLKFEEVKKYINEDIKSKILNGISNAINKNKNWLETLEIKENGKEETKGYNKLYEELRKAIENSEKIITIEDIIKKLLKEENLEENLRNKLDKICKVEEFLVALDNVFYDTLEKRDIKKVDKELVKKLKNKYEKLEENIIFDLKKQYSNLMFELEKKEENYDEIIKSIIEDHKILEERNNKRPWIEIDKKDNIIRNHNLEKEINEEWNHHYYIDIVQNIIRSLNNE